MPLRRLVRCPLVLSLLAALAAVFPLGAQSALDRSPTLSGGWTGEPGTVWVNFLHRFRTSQPPERKVSASPTFLIGVPLPARTLVGAWWASNSDVAPRFPNEWELFGRVAPWRQGARAPVDVAIEAAYNAAARSADGELSLARAIGPVRLIAAGRVLGDAFDTGETRAFAAGGVSVRLHRWLALAGDVAAPLEHIGGVKTAWSAGVQFQLPYTPHTISLHATNTNTGTLQGSSRGLEDTRWGFEFTIPFTVRRYVNALRGGRRAAPAATPGARDSAGGARRADTVVVSVKSLTFAPARVEVAAGTTVVWRNDDPLAHTATADGGAWDSGLIEPGNTWAHTFREVGELAYHCMPHPFMKGVVVVRGAGR